MYVWLCMVGAGNKLGAVGMAALAPALSKLVALTSVSLNSTWVAMWLCVQVSLSSGDVWRLCVLVGREGAGVTREVIVLQS